MKLWKRVRGRYLLLGLLGLALGVLAIALLVLPGKWLWPGQLRQFGQTGAPWGVERIELQTKPQAGLAAYTYGDVLVVIGGESDWVWRGPDGKAQLRAGHYSAVTTKLHCDGQRLLIANAEQGRLDCYRYPDGELLWQADGLGKIVSAAWTADYAWLLNGPTDPSVPLGPDGPEVVLHRVDLETGERKTEQVRPPAGRWWVYGGGTEYAVLAANREQAWLIGSCSATKPPYTEPAELLKTAGSTKFIVRPAQGELRQSSCLLPDGLWPFAIDPMDELHYCVTGDSVVDIISSPFAVPHFEVRARSLATGRKLWQRSFPIAAERSFMARAFSAGKRIILNGDEGPLCLDAQSGAELWRFPQQARIRWAEAVATDEVVFGLTNGTVARVAASGKPVWQFAAAGQTRLDAVDHAQGLVYFRDSEQQSGENTWYQTGGRQVVLNLADGQAKAQTSAAQLDGRYYVTGQGYIWQTKSYPGRPQDGRAIYRFSNGAVPIHDMNQSRRDDLVIRQNYLLAAERTYYGLTRLVLIRLRGR